MLAPLAISQSTNPLPDELFFEYGKIGRGCFHGCLQGDVSLFMLTQAGEDTHISYGLIAMFGGCEEIISGNIDSLCGEIARLLQQAPGFEFGGNLDVVG